MAVADATDVFVLLDNADPVGHAGWTSSRLYTGFVRTWACHDPSELDACWRAAEQDLQRGMHAVVLADYEWGARLQDAGTPVETGAAFRLLIFERMRRLDEEGVRGFLRHADGGSEMPAPAGTMDLREDVDRRSFDEAIALIHEAIRNGETYQVNYTYRLTGRAWGSPVALYRRLRAKQRVGFGALVALPPGSGEGDATHVLSCSPELFLRHEEGEVTARPMKGTAPRHAEPDRDAQAAMQLQRDVKNRSENVMIVDLLRNDLGRIARIGSVQVPSLFSIEPYATVFQMTSTVRARLRPGIDGPALLRATFPCGSITGAPKLAAMNLIRRIEASPRGAYCGAIGWVDAPRPASAHGALGDVCLSVAIRTMTLSEPQKDGTRELRMGVGAGIVQDSVTAQEYAECRLKARFLTDLDPGLRLFETFRVEAQPLPTALHRELHLARLARSARALGFTLDLREAGASLDAALLALSGQGPWRLRLDLEHCGAVRVSSSELPPLKTDGQGCVSLAWSSTVLPRGDALAAHKTTRRAHYDTAVLAAEAAGCFDQLFVNASARVAEGARSSLFVLSEGIWHTPPVNDGALPGICRAMALARGIRGIRVVERSMGVQDVLNAEALAVGNALRGVVLARLARDM